jgi:DNA-binding Lrp family transcriptional regulator
MKAKDLKILQELRNNSRRSLTEIGTVTNVPLSTVFKKVDKLEKGLIKKYVSLIDFSFIGFSIRVSLVLKSKDRESLRKFLLEHPNVNSVYRTSQDFDFFVETIFPDMLGLEGFMEELNGMVSDKKIFHVIEEIRKEDFNFLKDEQVK